MGGSRGTGAAGTAAPAVRADAVVKDYGAVRALDGLDLEVARGEVLGFIGPNGAGKSTTIRLLLDVLRPTSGRLEVLGAAPAAGGPALRARIGYLPGELAMTSRTSAGRLGLDLDRPVRSLSKGNRQKVGLVAAFAHDPELLVLDEPTSGLDPLLQREFLAMVREARGRGASVLMSSHVLSEVEDVADRVAVLRAGRVVVVEDVASLRRRAGQRVELTFAGSVVAAGFAGLDGVEQVVVEPHGDGSRLTCLLRGEPDALLKAAAGHRVTSWSAADHELEELFAHLYRAPGATPRRTRGVVDDGR